MHSHKPGLVNQLKVVRPTLRQAEVEVQVVSEGPLVHYSVHPGNRTKVPYNWI